MNTLPAKKNSSLTGSFIEVFKTLSFADRYGLKKWFIIPFIINLAVLGIICFFAFKYIRLFAMDYMLSVTAEMDTSVQNVLSLILSGLICTAIAVGTGFIYPVIGNIITAPSNDSLSEKVENILTGRTFNEKAGLAAAVRSIFRTLGNLIKFLILSLVLLIPVSLSHLLPGAGEIISTILEFLVSCFFLGFQFLDYPLDRRKLSFMRKLGISVKNCRITLGTGLASFLLTYIPVFGFLGINMCTISATKLFTEHIEPELEKERKEE